MTATALSAGRFRHVLGHLATGVAVVTSYRGHEPKGIAVNSVTSVSLDPPMILVCPAKSSSTWPHIRAAGRFCVNILAYDQRAACLQFARPGCDRFAGVAYHERGGAPALDDALAWIDAAIHAEHDAGDHTVVLADVLAIDATERAPLVFFRGRYGTFEICEEL
jgi:3-hydroxy-9,10-secoandrosta-1,3,5(10)-triene-9,17-dione monooxygenase reductase component